MNWAWLAIASGLGLVARNIFFKMAAEKIDAALGAAILSVAMAAVAVAYFLYQRAYQNPPVETEISPQGVTLAIVAGVGVAAANIFLAFAYQGQGPVSLVSIVQNGFAISVTILVGVLMFGESISLIQALGICAAVLGVFMITKG